MIVRYNPQLNIETKVINEFPFRSAHTHTLIGTYTVLHTHYRIEMTAFKIEMNFTLMNIYLVRFK